MHLYRLLAPTALPISLQEVKSLANLEGEDDAKIMAYVRTAVERIDGPDGEIQRALISQSWELRLDAFPGYWPHRPHFRWPADFCPQSLEIEVPLPPLREIVEITYLSGGVETTLDAAEYAVAGVGDRHKARIRPVSSWPGADDVAEAVTVSFVAGYGPDWNFVPEPVRLAIAGMVRDLFDGCDSGLPEKLLSAYRVDLGFA